MRGSSRPVELNDIQLCYFAALIDALRLINEKERERPGSFNDKDFDASAIAEYVRTKGDMIVQLCYPDFRRGDQGSLPESSQSHRTPRARQNVSHKGGGVTWKVVEKSMVNTFPRTLREWLEQKSPDTGCIAKGLTRRGFSGKFPASV